MAPKKRGLGRNLEVLLGDIKMHQETHLEGNLCQLSTNQVQAGKFQPRQDFSEEALEELASSIRAQGIIQPIVVRSQINGYYEIIAGERRFRAAKLAGLKTIPALIRELPDEAAVAIALIENIQREDLNPLEEANAMQRLIQEFCLTHDQVANAVGKSRATVSNLLRLLVLPEQIKNLLVQKRLEMGHARALLSLNVEQQLELSQEILAKKMTVRETEASVRKLLEPKKTNPMTNEPIESGSNFYEIQNKLFRKWGLPVVIKQVHNGSGKMTFSFKNNKSLQQLLTQMLGAVDNSLG